MYIYLNHFVVYQKPIPYCKSSILQYKIKIKLKKNSYNLIANKINLIFQRAEIFIDIVSKKIYKLSTGTWKDGQHSKSLEKCKSKLQCSISDHMLSSKRSEITCWGVCGEKGTFRRWWWEGRMVQPVCKTVWRVFRKQKLKLPHDPAVSLLGIHIWRK